MYIKVHTDACRRIRNNCRELFPFSTVNPLKEIHLALQMLFSKFPDMGGKVTKEHVKVKHKP